MILRRMGEVGNNYRSDESRIALKGVEIFRNGHWRPLDPKDDFSRDRNLCESQSISEQVAQIAMPEVTHSHEA